MQLLLNALIAGSLLALLSTGLSFVYGLLGSFNLALGQLALVGGYSVWWLTEQGLPFAVSLPLGIIVMVVVSAISFECFYAPFYTRHRFLPIVTTVALGMVLDGLILLVFHEYPRTMFEGHRTLIALGSGVISLPQLILVLSTIGFLCAVALILASTSIGRCIRATVQHRSAAESLGINAAWLHRIVFIISGVLAGLGGVYLAIDQNITPTLAFPLTIKAYAALIAGGRESLKGTILCAYLIALLEQLAVGIPLFGWYIPAGFQSAVALLVIVVVLLIKPEGIFGSRLRTT